MGTSGEVTEVRHLLRTALEPLLTPERLDEAELMVSEVVTNAVLHARPPIRVHARVLGARLVVAVADAGSGLSEQQRADHGRGLSIVESLAERCGAWVGETGGTVWFWLPTGRGAGRTTESPAGPATQPAT